MQIGEYLYYEDEPTNEIFFLIEGKAQFVLPRYDNTPYIDIQIGAHFGLMDICGSMKKLNLPIGNWFEHKNKLQRVFTVKSQSDGKLLSFSINMLAVMEKEFTEEYNELFNKVMNRLENALIIKLEATKRCQEQRNKAVLAHRMKHHTNKELSSCSDSASQSNASI